MAGAEGIARKDELSVPRRHTARTSREGLLHRFRWVPSQGGEEPRVNRTTRRGHRLATLRQVETRLSHRAQDLTLDR